MLSNLWQSTVQLPFALNVTVYIVLAVLALLFVVADELEADVLDLGLALLAVPVAVTIAIAVVMMVVAGLIYVGFGPARSQAQSKRRE